MELRGQWRIAPMGGAVALDYTALFLRMERMSLDDVGWLQMYDDIRVLEAAALEQMRENSN
jgi:hypothetical protein